MSYVGTIITGLVLGALIGAAGCGLLSILSRF